jgi:hypothetical protein
MERTPLPSTLLARRQSIRGNSLQAVKLADAISPAAPAPTTITSNNSSVSLTARICSSHCKNIAAPSTIHGTSFPGHMRMTLKILGVLLVATGCIWFLQGINVIPGSFMTGQTKWAAYGAVSLIAGVGLVIAGSRRR